jgi:hypothetical protein
MMMGSWFVLVLVVVAVASNLSTKRENARKRAVATLANMTLAQKVSLLGGTSGPYAGQTVSIPSLNRE